MDFFELMMEMVGQEQQTAHVAEHFKQKCGQLMKDYNKGRLSIGDYMEQKNELFTKYTEAGGTDRWNQLCDYFGF